MNIAVKNVTKSYDHQKAVDNISFSVSTGEILGFLGPNGAGKTTTMKIITNYLSADSGDVEIAGESVKSGSFRKNIGYLAEHNPLYEDMPVMDFLQFCAQLQSVPKDQTHDRIIEMIKLCGLNDEKHKKIGELSKGYKQRTGLAQAMIHDPEILIFDEPTSGLDPNQIVEIRELIRRIGKEKTVILSTHILPEVEATCDRILIINKGKIVADGTANTLRKQASGNTILRLQITGAPVDSIAEKLRALSLVKEVQITNLDNSRFEVQSDNNVGDLIFKTAVKNKWVITEMIPVETKLEDIFRDLTLN
jgi:ABC-2 type transport system ATP-binding protein